MTQLILSPRNTSDSQQLAKTAELFGWQVCRLSSWRLEEGFKRQQSIVLYGEPLFCRIVAAQLSRVLLEPPHDWLLNLPNEYLRREVKYLSFAGLPSLDYPKFIKPPDDKLFAAKIYQDSSELLKRDDISSEQRVLVSEPISFHKEFRVHLRQGKAASVSRYMVHGELDTSADDPQNSEAARFAEEVYQAASAQTPPAVVIDVGIVNTESWAVVEANPCFGAGIYQGSPEGILGVLELACRDLLEYVPELEGFKYPLELE